MSQDLFNDSMLLASAVELVGRLRTSPTTDEHDARAIEVVLARLAHLEKLIDTTNRMRAAQQRYFRDRTGLPECKALEREVDKLVRV